MTEDPREPQPHSWRFDGDDPYLLCDCGERRDAITGRIITVGKGHADA